MSHRVTWGRQGAGTYPVLRRRYVDARDKEILRSRWKRRVELRRGTTKEEAGKGEGGSQQDPWYWTKAIK